MNPYTFIQPSAVYRLPASFDFAAYIDTEQELWAFFPETDGHRVNFAQIGLTAWIYCSVPESGAELADNETYIIMPCGDHTMRPIRMRAIRRLTLQEYRMGHLTALKLIGKINEAGEALREIGNEILGEEVIEEAQSRMSEQGD